MVSETTPLTSGEESRTYLFLSQRHRSRRTKIRQFQCCVCAAMLGIFVTAMVITVSYSMNHDPEDQDSGNDTNSDKIEVLAPAPAIQTPLNTLLSLTWPRPEMEELQWDGKMPTDLEISAALKQGEEKLKARDHLETWVKLQGGNTGSPGVLQLGTPSYVHQQAIKTTPEAIKASRVGYVIGVATEKLINKKMSKSAVGKGPAVHAYWLPTGMICDENEMLPSANISSTECPPTAYRTMDGTCNNLVHPDWGVAMRPFRRVLPPDYSDGISTPRLAKDGSTLPSARDVSLTVHRPVYRNDPKFTVMLAVWGQFFDHDITATALSKSKDGAPIACCTEEGTLATSKTHPECYPVVLSAEDPYYSEFGRTCMEFVRSAPAPTCNFGPREQLNQITSFIDGSVVYGASDEQAMRLRSPNGKGELYMMISPDGRELLPPSTDPRDGCNTPEMNKDGKYCFMSGDNRANENMHLTTMHLLLAREHNRVVRSLAQMNPSWNDEKLYQEGRRIVAAEMQHITYNEFLPVILGQSMMSKLNLAPKKDGYFTEYNPEVNPSVANNFATGAFRFAHTLLPTLMKIVDNDTSSEEYVELHKMLFNPYLLYSPKKLNAAINGALSTGIQKADTYITPEVTQHLFQQRWSEDYDKAQEKAAIDTPIKPKKKAYGLDLASLNVQRGRDHGLPSYPAWRKYCGLSVPKSFSDLQGQMDETALQRLSTLFKSVDDVDMYSGSLSEQPIGEGLLGPTFSCLIADQFLRLKTGDRYWYETSEKPQAFTPEQLKEIRKISLASVICDNSGVEHAQQWVMKTIDATNPRKNCTSIPRMQLEAWKDISMVGHVKLATPSVHARLLPKSESLSGITPPNKLKKSAFLKGNVVSASVTATDSNGNKITVLSRTTTFPKPIPLHLFDEKVNTSFGTGDGIIPLIYKGGGGITWTGSLTELSPTQVRLVGNFTVPSFKHGPTSFDFSINTYTGDFDVSINLTENSTLAGITNVLGTYKSGVYYQVEPTPSSDMYLSVMEMMEKEIEDVNKSGSVLPFAPILLYGVDSLDKTMFNWDGNISLILPLTPPPNLNMSPIVTSNIFLKGTVATSSVIAYDSDDDEVLVLTPTSTFPLSVPVHLFDEKVNTSFGTSNGIMPPIYKGGGGVTWTGSLFQESPMQVHLIGNFTVPLFKHGPTPFDFGINTYRGDFDITVNLIENVVLPDVLSTYTSGIYFQVEPPSLTESYPSTTEIVEFINEGESKSGSLLPSAPLILYGTYSPDMTAFNWNGNISLLLPALPAPTLSKTNSEVNASIDKGTSSSVMVTATWGVINGFSGPAIGNVRTKTVVTVSWDASSPVAIPQPAFDRIATNGSETNMVLSKASANGVTWFGTLSPVPGTMTGEVQLNGNYSFPVFIHGPKGGAGDPSVFTEQFWQGNFSMILRPSLIYQKEPLTSSLEFLLSGGPFRSPIYFQTNTSTVELLADDDDSKDTDPLVPIILHGYKSIDESMFFWTGNATISIPSPKTTNKDMKDNTPKIIKENKSNTLKHLKAATVAPSIYLKLKLLSASVNITVSTSKNAEVRNVSWNGIFPVTFPQPAFYHTEPRTIKTLNKIVTDDSPYSPLAKPSPYKSQVTWANLSAKVMNSTTSEVQVNGTFSFPIFNFGNTGGGKWTGPTVETWSGIFSSIFSPNSTVMSIDAISSLLSVISTGSFNTSVYFLDEPKVGTVESVMSNLKVIGVSSSESTEYIIILRGTKSPDKTEFYWNGDAVLKIPLTPLTGNDNLRLSAKPKEKVVNNLTGSYLSGKVTSGNIIASSTEGKIMLWNGELPLPIQMPAFDSVSPDAGVYTWPYDPTFYNGTGGVTWVGNMAKTTTVKNGIKVKGSFSVPVFTHGNPSVFSVAEWNGDFSLTISININRTGTKPILTEGTYNSPIFFRENRPNFMGDDEIISEVHDVMALWEAANLKTAKDFTLPRIPLILWGNYAADTKVFYWLGNVSAIFPSSANSLTSSSVAMAMKQPLSLNEENRVRMSITVKSGSITASPANSPEKTLWDGTLPFVIKTSEYQRLSKDGKLIGGPVSWKGHMAVGSSINEGRLEGSFSFPVLLQSNTSTLSFETWSGDFSFLLSLPKTTTAFDLLPGTGPFVSKVVLGSLPLELGLQIKEFKDRDPLEMTIYDLQDYLTVPDDSSYPKFPIYIAIIPQGNFSSDRKTFTWTGETDITVPVMSTSLKSSKILEMSKIQKPFVESVGAPIGMPIRRKIFGFITSGEISGDVSWDGTFPAVIPIPAFNRFSNTIEEMDRSTLYSQRPEGGITWKLTSVSAISGGVKLAGNYFFPINIHGRLGTFSVSLMKGTFSFDAMLPGDQNTDRLATSVTYRSPIYFHNSKSDWDPFNLVEDSRDISTHLGVIPGYGIPEKPPIFVLNGRRDKSSFSWSGKFVIIFPRY